MSRVAANICTKRVTLLRRRWNASTTSRICCARTSADIGLSVLIFPDSASVGASRRVLPTPISVTCDSTVDPILSGG
ncbi:hypothetical protein ATN79_25900 [Paraburkholderia caribensis]|nr:hypothetical protein ATN79_25900 [Paraburkholderia caribensis]